MKKDGIFGLCIVMFFIGFMLCGALLNGNQNEAISKPVLNNICKLFYGENASFVDTRFGTETSFSCKIKEPILLLAGEQ